MACHTTTTAAIVAAGNVGRWAVDVVFFICLYLQSHLNMICCVVYFEFDDSMVRLWNFKLYYVILDNGFCGR